MSRRKVSVNCLFCSKEFETTLRWEGVPEKEYCSQSCQDNDDEFSDEVTFEKFSKSNKDGWN